MADQLQLRGGTTAQTAAFTGALREVTVDLDKDTLVVHDGALAGGYPLMRENGSNSALALGSAATPSLKFTGDTNTGIYSPGADQVAVSTGGTNRLHITSAGLVGIGNSSPGAKLDISGSGNLVRLGDGTNTFDVRFQGPNNWDVQLDASADTFSIRRNSSSKVTVSPAGNVGIGTTSPTFAAGGGVQASFATFSSFRATSGSNTGTDFAAASDGKGYIYVRDNADLLIGTNNAERARIDSSGRLLVGTSTARSNIFNASYSALFQVETDTTVTSQALLTSATAGVQGARLTLAHQRSGGIGGNTILQSGDETGFISFQGSDGSEFVESASIKGEVDGTPSANDMPGRLVFSTTADGAASPTERMRINNTGSVTAQGATSVASGTHSFQDNGSSPNTVRLYNNTDSNNTGNRFLICDAGSSVLRAEIRSNGGLANFSANNANLSDRNAKKDISPAVDTWDCLKEWEIVNYRYKDQPEDADLNLGVIAQQVAESCPEVITVFQQAKEATEDAPAREERLGVKEQQMYWMAIKALQEAQVRIEQLESKVAALEGA
jgi:hypothetical protein